MTEVDVDKMKKQLDYMRKLKRMKTRTLRKLHNKVFKGTRFNVHIPTWLHRSHIERRIWYYYCVKNYHYEDSHPITKAFRKKARKLLSQHFEEIRQEELTLKRLKDLERFSKRNIKSMPIEEVDRYLAALGVFVGDRQVNRRKLLWEYFNEPLKHLPRAGGAGGKELRAHRRGRFNNQLVLRDLILAAPTMGYDEFRYAYGNIMPTVTRASYNTTRSVLRKGGYKLPHLKRGPRSPALEKGKKARNQDDK